MFIFIVAEYIRSDAIQIYINAMRRREMLQNHADIQS
jgi:hypothetical protein